MAAPKKAKTTKKTTTAAARKPAAKKAAPATKVSKTTKAKKAAPKVAVQPVAFDNEAAYPTYALNLTELFPIWWAFAWRSTLLYFLVALLSAALGAFGVVTLIVGSIATSIWSLQQALLKVRYRHLDIYIDKKDD